MKAPVILPPPVGGRFHLNQLKGIILKKLLK